MKSLLPQPSFSYSWVWRNDQTTFWGQSNPGINCSTGAFALPLQCLPYPLACVQLLQLCPALCNPMDWGHQAPLDMGSSRQEYWSGLPWPSPRALPNPGMEPRSLKSPALAGRFFTTSLPRGKPSISTIRFKLMFLTSGFLVNEYVYRLPSFYSVLKFITFLQLFAYCLPPSLDCEPLKCRHCVGTFFVYPGLDNAW